MTQWWRTPRLQASRRRPGLSQPALAVKVDTWPETISLPNHDQPQRPRREHSRGVDITRALLIASSAGLAFTLFVINLLEAVGAPWFEQRLAPIIGLAYGYTICQRGASGPLFVCIYGPLSYLAYLPIAFLRQPVPLFIAGSVCAAIFLSLPAVTVLAQYYPKRRQHPFDAGPAILLFFVFLVSIPSLTYAMSFVSSDAPAICLVTLGCWYLCRAQGSRRPTVSVSVSTLLLVCGVACKQNMIFVPLILLPATGILYSWRLARHYVAATVLWTGVMLGFLALVYRDLGALYFEAVVVPQHWPISQALFPKAVWYLYQNSLPLGPSLILILLLAYLLERRHTWSWRSWARGRPQPFFLAALSLLPSSILTFAGAGGAINSFAHAIYLFIFGIFVWSLELLEKTRESPVNHAALRGCFLAAAALLLVTVSPYRLSPYALRHVDRPSGLRAYLYAKEHPGSVYFPSNPVATFLAEGTFYDTEWGVMNRVLSGNAPSAADIWRHVPPMATTLAYPRGFGGGFLVPFIAPTRIPVKNEALEDFELFRIERP